MKTDKELLELAAKAAGLNCKWFKLKKFSNVKSGGRVVGRMHSGYDEVFGTHHKKPWNPIESDGDALRLAVKLDIDVMPKWGGESCAAISDGGHFFEPRELDPLEATRRAIVRAAAAIGEKL